MSQSKAVKRFVPYCRRLFIDSDIDNQSIYSFDYGIESGSLYCRRLNTKRKEAPRMGGMKIEVSECIWSVGHADSEPSEVGVFHFNTTTNDWLE